MKYIIMEKSKGTRHFVGLFVNQSFSRGWKRTTQVAAALGSWSPTRQNDFAGAASLGSLISFYEATTAGFNQPDCRTRCTQIGVAEVVDGRVAHSTHFPQASERAEIALNAGPLGGIALGRDRPSWSPAPLLSSRETGNTLGILVAQPR